MIMPSYYREDFQDSPKLKLSLEEEVGTFAIQITFNSEGVYTI